MKNQYQYLKKLQITYMRLCNLHHPVLCRKQWVNKNIKNLTHNVMNTKNLHCWPVKQKPENCFGSKLRTFLVIIVFSGMEKNPEKRKKNEKIQKL